MEESDITNDLDADVAPRNSELEAVETRGKPCEHRTNRVPTDRFFAVARSDEEHIFCAEVEHRLDVTPIERSVERCKRLANSLSVVDHGIRRYDTESPSIKRNDRRLRE